MSETQTPMQQRIKILIDELEGGVQRKFAQSIGVHPTTINEILGKRQNQPSAELLQKVAAAYPQLLMEWLIRGEGEMLKPVLGQNTGINNSDVYTAPKKAAIDPRLLTGDTSQDEEPTFSYPHAEADPKQVLGNMVEQLNQNTSDIEKLRAAVFEIQRQLNS